MLAGNEAVLDFTLNEYSTTADVISKMEEIRNDYHGGNTNTTGGLRVMREQVTEVQLIVSRRAVLNSVVYSTFGVVH